MSLLQLDEEMEPFGAVSFSDWLLFLVNNVGLTFAELNFFSFLWFSNFEVFLECLIAVF